MLEEEWMDFMLGGGAVFMRVHKSGEPPGAAAGKKAFS